MSTRHWLVSDGTARSRGHVVPAGHGYQVILWDGKTEWTPPAGAIPEPETAATASKRPFWRPPAPVKPKRK